MRAKHCHSIKQSSRVCLKMMVLFLCTNVRVVFFLAFRNFVSIWINLNFYVFFFASLLSSFISNAFNAFITCLFRMISSFCAWHNVCVCVCVSVYLDWFFWPYGSICNVRFNLKLDCLIMPFVFRRNTKAYTIHGVRMHDRNWWWWCHGFEWINFH